MPSKQNSNRASPVNFSSEFHLEIVLHTASGPCSRRRPKMDTGAEINIITQEAVSELNVLIRKYRGDPLRSFGPPSKPLGETTLSWNVDGRQKIHETPFFVVLDSMGKIRRSHWRGMDCRQ